MSGTTAPSERLAWLGPILWPDGATVQPPGVPPAPGSLAVLPSASRPRVLLPVGNPRAAAVVAGGLTGPAALPAGLLGAAAGVAARFGLPDSRLVAHLGPTDGEPGLLDHLVDELGATVTAGVRTGPPRVNRKPVLQLVTPEGDTVGWAKIGWNALTRDLVAGEAATLRSIGGRRLRHLSVPQVLTSGRWRGLEYLVLAPLPGLHRRVPRARLAAALTELAALEPTTTTPLAASTFLADLRRRAAERPDVTRGIVHDTLDRLALTRGVGPLVLGAGHGDLSPWNVGRSGRRVSVLDWERFRPAVPVGFDLAHYAVTPPAGARPETLRASYRRATGTITEWLSHAAPDQDPGVVSLLHAIDLLLRHRGDGRARRPLLATIPALVPED